MKARREAPRSTVYHTVERFKELGDAADRPRSFIPRTAKNHEKTCKGQAEVVASISLIPVWAAIVSFCINKILHLF